MVRVAMRVRPQIMAGVAMPSATAAISQPIPSRTLSSDASECRATPASSAPFYSLDTNQKTTPEGAAVMAICHPSTLTRSSRSTRDKSPATDATRSTSWSRVRSACGATRRSRDCSGKRYARIRMCRVRAPERRGSLASWVPRVRKTLGRFKTNFRDEPS